MISERSIRSGQLMGGWYQCFFRRLDTLSSRREERRYVVVLFPADPA
jgi:hypothetical protein